MALGLSSGGGEGTFNAVCKYNAKAGRMYKIERTQDAAGNYSNDEVEITSGFQAVFDLANIEVGWAKFVKGQAPDWKMVNLGSPLPNRPEGVGTDGKPLYKQAFRMMIKLGKSSGGDVREFASSAGCVISAIDALHSQYEAESKANPGKLPVVAMPTTVKTAGKGGDSNYAPVFTITGWVDRPSELAANANAPVEQGAAQQAAPVQQAITTNQAAPAADEF